MIPDKDTNIVFVSALLGDRHPEVNAVLAEHLGDRLQIIPGTQDIWCRDFMPIQLTPDRFVEFRYAPDYLENDAQLVTEDAAGLLDLTMDCLRSPLVIDGGNIVRWHDTAILTDKVYRENPDIARPDLRRQLQEALRVERLVIIPKEPGDIIGHSDGIVRFVDRDKVLVNDYHQINSRLGQRLLRVLHRHGLNTISFPYCPTDEEVDGIPSAKGCYINFLQIDSIIFVPAFELGEDDEAVDILEQHFSEQQIVRVSCCDLARRGGVLNCVTWNVRTGRNQQ